MQIKSNQSIHPQIGMVVKFIPKDGQYASKGLETSLFTIIEIFINRTAEFSNNKILARFVNNEDPNEYWNILEEAWNRGGFIIFNNSNFNKKKTRLRFLS